MKLAFVTLNPTVGAVARNAEKIAKFVDTATASGCHAVIFPEMALTGYPPRDLLFYDIIHEQQARALQSLKRLSKKIVIVVGGVERNPGRGAPFRNVAFILRNGQRSVYAKQLLPEYDVFDERRYFEPGIESLIFKIGREKCGITICEDLWGSDPQLKNRYLNDPALPYRALSPDWIINLSASPFERGKITRRSDAIRTAARKIGASVALVNQSGANDDLVFDGGVYMCDAKGKTLHATSRFREDLYVIDTTQNLTQTTESLDAFEEIRRALVLGIRDYVLKTGNSRVVLGLSGGIDSSLVAQLAVEALGAENVHGVLLPSRYTSDASIEDASRLAKNLRITTRFIDIGGLHKEYEKTFKKTFGKTGVKDLTAQNVQARIRGNVLMAISNNENRLLLNTTNKSEMAMGYGTLYGDMCGALAVISDLVKEDVYALSRHMNPDGAFIPESVFDKPPTAELKPGQKDSDTLPPYDVLDPIVRHWVEDERLSERDWRAHAQIVRSFCNSEFKRRQAPIGLKITGKAFGSGRRFPIAARIGAPVNVKKPHAPK